MKLLKKSKILLRSSLLLIGAAFAFSAAAALNNTNNQTYEEARATTYDGWSHEEHGDGSYSSPYLIYTTGDLYKFRDIVNGDNGETKNVNAYANLMQDITFEGTNNWTTNFRETYKGTFQGYNHSISGLDATFENTSFGFFSTNSGTIRDLIIKDSKFTGSGTRFGVFCHTITDNSTAEVYNCYSVNNTITITIEDGESTNYYVGGIAGYVDSGYVQRCSNDSDITVNGTGTNFYVGGMVGYTIRMSCLDCFNIGTINTNNPAAHLGGIIGGINTSGTTYVRRVFSRGHFTFPEGAMVGAIFGTAMATYTSSNYYLDDGTNIYGIGGTTSDDEEYIKRYTADQFKVRENFHGFDFDKVWEIVNNSYPTYRNFYYVSRSWDSTNKVVVSEEKFIPQVAPFTETTTTISSNWYVVNSDVTVLNRIVLYNATTVANLVLCDGFTLTVNKGITVGEGQTLNIYCQTLGTGALIVSAAESDYPLHNAGIGGANGASFSGCGTINIFGGNITVNGVDDSYGAQIGSVSNQEGGTINIYGGTIDVNPNNATTHGAGIGGGGFAADSVTIYGGYVTARSYYGAGIGGGDNSDGCSVTINGGEVTAIGGSGAAGIGGGPSHNNGTLTVNDLSVLGNDEHEPTISDTQTDYSTNRWRYMKVGNFHTHHFAYEKTSETTITATCDNEDGNCPLPEHKATLTISAPSGSLIYDGDAKPATYVDTSNGVAFSNITLSYFKGETPIAGEPAGAGTYVATISIDESTETIFVGYVITKANSSVTVAPTANVLTYDGLPQNLVTAGTADGGTMQYKIGNNGVWSEEIPTATNAGTYNVYYKVVGDDNHNDFIEETPIEVIINKANVILTAPTPNSRTWDGQGHDLIYPGSVDFGDILYASNTTGNLPDDNEFSTAIPTAINEGHYYVFYKASGDANHNAVPASLTNCVEVDISEAMATIKVGSDITYYNSLESALSNWVDGSTLTLLKDITTSDTINVNSNVTLDLNGCGIKATSTDYSVLTINDGGKLTIIDSGNTTQYFTIADRYAGNGAGFATICDRATYDAADESLRGTFQGGYITGGNIISTGFYQSKAGAITVMTGGELDFIAGTIIGNSGGKESPGGVSSFGTFTLNGGNIIYNRGRRGSGVFLQVGTFVMNSGTIEYNTGVGANEYGTAALHAYTTESISLNGGSISHNYVKYGGIATSTNIFLSGDFVAVDNVACGSTGTEAANGNIRLTDGALISGCITGNTPIGISLGSGRGVFTNSIDTSINDPSKFVSDNPNYAIGVYPAGHEKAGQLFIDNKVTVTYTTEHGTAPISDTVANGSIIYNEPTSPSQEGYEIKGWYKDEEFENVWDFATDTVTSDTTLYAKWDYDEATGNVIKLINDIGDLTYAGGVNDSLDDIIAAKTAYDALTPGQQAVVNGVNKDVLDHDILTYRHVDNVGDLIKEIPELSDSQEYYDAVDAALAAYDALTKEEKAILNADLDFQYKKTLDDNIAAKEVIELIQDIGDVTYKGGQDDSKDDIDAAIDAYNNLTDDQKAIVDNANKDALDDAKETYDNVDETVRLIESIGSVSHGGENDSKEAIDAAKVAYDSLTPEEKALVASYNNSEKVLKDDEAVYGAMEAIDSIGGVAYTTESEEAIKHAQDIYGSLTEDQKEQLGDGYRNVLIDAGNKYETVSKQGDILFLILIIVASLTLVGGIVFLYFLIKKKRKNNDDQGGDNSKGKPVKAYSFGGLVTFPILVSHYFDAKYITLYVLAALAIAIWIACLIVALTIKRKKAVKEETKPQQVKETNSQENNKDEEEVETITDEKGNIFQIRFIKSFTAKLIQSPEETKKYYEELKNEVLSYKKTNSRVSWHYDAINSGREYVLKFAVKGKTLCVYFPLNADDYADSKYKVEKAESRKFEDVPCLYRIKNDRRLGYAKELIAVVANNLGLEKGEEQHEVYSNLPYEPNKPLVARGLIKEQKVQVNKPSEPVILESKVNSEGDEVIITKDSSGNLFEIRYIKSFTAKLSQSEDLVKDYYTKLKNYVLSYKDTHSRVSWHYDAINVGRDYILKFAIRGKTLCVYYALDASKLDDKYKVEKAESRKFEDVPCLYRIKNDRRLGYAKELIDILMSDKGISKGKEQNEDYHIPSESTKALLAKGLIKEVKSKVQNKEVIKHYESISVSKADEEMSDEKAESFLEEVDATKRKEGKKEIINIDTLSEYYSNGDEVTLESLIEKGLVSSKAGHIKVLARGELNKKLDVVANDFSIQAIKMIVLVGGHAKKIK